MATVHRILSRLLLSVLLWSPAALLPAVAQIGPEFTRFPVEEKSSLRVQLAEIYQGQIGTREAGKNNHGAGPKKYLAACGLPEGYAYCACFVKWSLLQIGIMTQGTAWSPSWATGKEVFWKQGVTLSARLSGRQGVEGGVEKPVILSEVEGPRPGDVFTLYYANLKRVGHVGFIEIWDDPRADDWVFTVEGNTNGEGSREGDGVHRRRRLKRSIYTIANYLPD